MFTASLAGIDLGTSLQPVDPWVEVRNHDVISATGFDRVRLRFSEPVAAVEGGTLDLVTPRGNIPGDITSGVAIADDGLSAEWQLPRTLGDEFVAIKNIDRLFADADSGELVADVVYRLGFLGGDSNRDGEVKVDDFLDLSRSFGDTGKALASDFNRNGRVDVSDFLILSRNFSTELDPGINRQNAFDVTGGVELANEVGLAAGGIATDLGDVYRLTLTEDSDVTISISDVTERTNFYLYSDDRDSDGGVFDSRERLETRENVTGNVVITETLAGRAGGSNYFLRVVAANGSTSSSYQLGFEIKRVLALNLQDPDSSRANALSVGTMPSLPITGVVTAGVDSDAYKLTLTEDARVTIDIADVEESTHFYLYSQDRDNDGGVFDNRELLESFQFVRGDRMISETLSGRESGLDYFLRVVPAENASSSRYEIGIQVDPLHSALLRDPGGNRDNALAVDLDSSPRFTGVATAGVDWDAYKFTLTQDSTVTIDISDVEESTHFYLYSQDRDNDGGVFDNRELLESFEFVRGDRVISETLAGHESGLDYFLRVVPAENASNSGYEVGFRTVPIGSPNLQNPGSSRHNALSIDLASAPRVTGVVTAGVDWDAYKFTLTEDSTVTFTIEGVDESTHFYLYGRDLDNDGGLFDSRELVGELEFVTGSRTLTTTLSPDSDSETYYLRVVPAENASSGRYSLRFSTQ